MAVLGMEPQGLVPGALVPTRAIAALGLCSQGLSSVLGLEAEGGSREGLVTRSRPWDLCWAPHLLCEGEGHELSPAVRLGREIIHAGG